MHKIIMTFGLLAALAVSGPTVAQSNGASELCGPNGPESYKRAGGYCDMLGGGGSLSEVGTGVPAGLVWPEPEEDDCLCAEAV